MNDPHVVALLYDVEHDQSVDYGKAEPIEREEEEFRVRVEDEQVRFEMKQHYASADEAKDAVRDYICVWEFWAGLQYGRNSFKLVFAKFEIRDRKPTPREIRLVADGVRSQVHSSAVLTVGRPYPPPPTLKRISPNAKSIYDRFVRYRAGHEQLAAMAYFGLTVLEAAAQQSGPQRERKPSGKRKKASEKYRIGLEVLNKIGELTSERGSSVEARKAYGTTSHLKPFTNEERGLLIEAIKRIIYRVAETESDPGEKLPEIKLSEIEDAVSRT